MKSLIGMEMGMSTLYLSGVWLGLFPRTDTKKTYVLKKNDGLHAQNMIIGLVQSVNIIGETYMTIE